MGETLDVRTVDEIIAKWDKLPREIAETTIERHGSPDEVSESRLIWHQRGPWKQTILYRDPVPHKFPKPHKDHLEQFVDYRVPPEKFDEIAVYDGSVTPERTKGELSARCDKEEMNFIALNLAHDIITGKRTVKEARTEYTEQAIAFMMGKPAPYTEGLNFETTSEETADPDEQVVTTG